MKLFRKNNNFSYNNTIDDEVLEYDRGKLKILRGYIIQNDELFYQNRITQTDYENELRYLNNEIEELERRYDDSTD